MLYVDQAGYDAYFGTSVAVPEFNYKEQIAVDLFKSVLPQPVLSPDDYNLGTYYKNQFDASLFEQIKYFTDNPNLYNVTTDTTEFKILGYSEKAEAFNSENQLKRVSPNAWLKLQSICLTKASIPTIG